MGASIDFNMPLWYGGDYHGRLYADYVKEGAICLEGIGKSNGGTDLIPLLNLSMGADLVDPYSVAVYSIGSNTLREQVSQGCGYYIGTNAFADAKCTAAFSKVHTLIADIEDFYADGARDDSLVKVTQLASGGHAVMGTDPAGNQAMVDPESHKQCARAQAGQGR